MNRLEVKDRLQFEETQKILADAGYAENFDRTCRHAFKEISSIDDENKKISLLYGALIAAFACGYDICRASHLKGNLNP